MKLRNIYVLVQDTDRAIKFYTEILGFHLHSREERYTILNLDDVWFGLLNEKFEDDVKRGNNCVPVFEVNNIEQEYERLKRHDVTFVTELLKLPDVSLFQFYDSERNILEMYEKKSNYIQKSSRVHK